MTGSTTTTTRTARLAATALAGGLLLAPLAGCTFTSNNVSCSTSSCAVTLNGDGATADILGTELRFGGVENGRASLGVGDVSVTCAQGESVAAGPLQLECTEVTEDSVELTATVN
ncbi:hypothetical protein ACI8AF_04575 [Blastococcus sp. SYSU D00669]